MSYENRDSAGFGGLMIIGLIISVLLLCLCAGFALASPYAIGGYEITDGETYIHIFNLTGSFTFNTTEAINASVLVVAGGGGGGARVGGGGGAGGLIFNNTYTFPIGKSNITIGAGGAGGSADVKGTSGQNTTLNGFTAIGGGGGGSLLTASSGINGGSGGGGGYPYIENGAGGLGTAGQGNFAGGLTFGGGGGGGGSGFNGLNGTTDANGGIGGKGGNGTYYNMTGIFICYAGGGGGGGSGVLNSIGGNASCGGGNGSGANLSVYPQNAINGTGGGGGGSGQEKDPPYNSNAGGGGGNGIVIIKYFITACLPDWDCESFAECDTFNNSECLNMTDINICNETFGGNISDYDAPCVFCDPSWVCDSFSNCRPENITECWGMNDNNNCNKTFGGNLTDYNGVCVYISPTFTTINENMIFMGILLFFWLGLVVTSFIFRNFALGSFMWLVGLILGFMTISISFVLGMSFVLFSTLMFMGSVTKFK